MARILRPKRPAARLATVAPTRAKARQLVRRVKVAHTPKTLAGCAPSAVSRGEEAKHQPTIRHPPQPHDLTTRHSPPRHCPTTAPSDGGTWSNTSASKCTSCAPGTWSAIGASTCYDCPVGYYAPSNGSTLCSLCSHSFDSGHTSQEGSSTCDECTKGYFKDLHGECVLCDEGIECGSGTFGPHIRSMAISKGYYRFSEVSTIGYECRYPRLCRGGNATGASSCAAGTEGPLCNSCQVCWNVREG